MSIFRSLNRGVWLLRGESFDLRNVSVSLLASKWQIRFRVSVVPGSLERRIITDINQFSYNYVVPESTLSASFHEKGHTIYSRDKQRDGISRFGFFATNSLSWH